MQTHSMTQSACMRGSVLLPARCTQQWRSPTRPSIIAMSTRKVNTVDDKWKKGFFTSGYLVEDRERAPVDTLKVLEKKKLLSQAAKLGLLSKADKAGFSLAKVEELKLLSTVERLGLLSLAEKALTSDPGAISSLSILPFLAAVGSLVFIPQDNAPESVLRLVAAGGFFAVFGVLFFGGFVIGALQED